VLALGLALAGCGDGGSGGVVSTGPGPTYTKVADLKGDHTFQTAGVQYDTGTAGFTNGSTQAFGSGVTVAYTASTDSYKLTAPDNSTVTFGPADAVAPTPSTPPNTQVWSKANADGTVDRLTLIVPTTAQGVPLSYTIVGTWGRTASFAGPGIYRIAIGGAPTLANDMPRTGSATYAVEAGGDAVQNGITYNLSGNSSATFSANFASNSVTTTLTLAGTPPLLAGSAVTQFGTFTGTGTISSSGPGFTGQLSGPAVNGAFSGAFFGPKALEMGYGWYLTGGTFSAAGAVTGVKQP
jgi:hypothetical protein